MKKKVSIIIFATIAVLLIGFTIYSMIYFLSRGKQDNREIANPATREYSIDNEDVQPVVEETTIDGEDVDEIGENGVKEYEPQVWVDGIEQVEEENTTNEDTSNEIQEEGVEEEKKEEEGTSSKIDVETEYNSELNIDTINR